MRSARYQNTATLTLPTISIPIPSIILSSLAALSLTKRNLKGRLFYFREDLKGKFPRLSAPHFSRPRLTGAGVKKALPLAILLVIIAGVLLWAKNIVTPSFSKNNNNDSATTLKGPRATLQLGKEYSFPIKDEKGKVVTKLTYFLDNAELRDEIIVSGQKATIVAGKTFLVLTIKLTNSYDQSIDINVRDYVRLSVNGNESEWLAADIHNDPVNIRPQSTKTTRIAFPINISDKKLKLRIGEVNGDKSFLDLNFKGSAK